MVEPFKPTLMIGHTSPTGLTGEYRADRWLFKYNNDGLRKRWLTCVGCLPDAAIASVSNP